jgi:hypothetical protein
MIANARMYAVCPQAAALWRTLLETVIACARVPVTVIEHSPPTPIESLWDRDDLAAVFMCGLPIARRLSTALPATGPPRPLALVAAPVPSPPLFEHAPCYWSSWIVRRESPVQTLLEALGGRLALTASHSQSGFIAPLAHLASLADSTQPMARPPATQLPATRPPAPAVTRASPPFRQLMAPTLTPRGALTAVVEGHADLAPIDGYAWCLLQQFLPDLTSRVRSIEATPRTVIPCLVASPDTPGSCVTALRRAFLEAHRVPALQSTLAALLLERFVEPDPGAYAALRAPAERALAYWRNRPIAADIDFGFPELRAG